MKISREARNTAKKLCDICRSPKGGVDESKVRQVISYVEKSKARNAVGILTHLHKLISLEIEENSALVESPVALSAAEKKSIKSKLTGIFGESTSIEFSERTELLGGIRIRKGSSVWDGSILGRLNELQKQF
ncbi:MAG: F0F1 ATP synthase subunit delta [Verrucomicrobiota bacterium]